MSTDQEKILELEAKVRQLQECLGRVGQPKEKRSQKDNNQVKETAPIKKIDIDSKGLTAKPVGDTDPSNGTQAGGKSKPARHTVTSELNPLTTSGNDTENVTTHLSIATDKHNVNSSSSRNVCQVGVTPTQYPDFSNSDKHGNGLTAAPIKKVGVSPSRLALFDHLPTQKTISNHNDIDPDRTLHLGIVKLGEMYRTGLLREDDDRVAALVAVFCAVIQDYVTPPNKSLSWDLDKHLRQQVQHLVDCRALCAGMGCLIKQLRTHISSVPPDMDEISAKTALTERLHAFMEDRMVFARESIGMLVADVIRDGDVILTFGSSPLLRKVLLSAAAHKKFHLIVVDSRPLSDGLSTLRACSPHIECVYTSLSGVAKVMGDAARQAMRKRQDMRVLLPASAMLSNGSMLAPAGTAIIASLARQEKLPVIALSESYKFSERVQLDSIVHNELGSPREIAVSDGVGGAVPQTTPGYYGTATKADGAALPFNVVNLRYDLTPISNISLVATETGLIPPTSVPVLLRELRLEMERNGALLP